MKETQWGKILKLHNSGSWVCGNAYRAEFIFSAHKRRQEISDHVAKEALQGWDYEFIHRSCEHGHKNVRDYYLKITRQESLPEREKVAATANLFGG